MDHATSSWAGADVLDGLGRLPALVAVAGAPGGGVAVVPGAAPRNPGSPGPLTGLSGEQTLAALQATPHLLVNAPMLLARLGLAAEIKGSLLPQLDILELFAFVRPAAFLVPTRGALAGAMGISLPHSEESGALAEASLLRRMAAGLLKEVALDNYIFRRGAVAAARILAQAAWPWAPLVLAALAAAKAPDAAESLAMPEEWRDGPWRSGRARTTVAGADARQRLSQMLGEGAEARPTQEDYTDACCAAFQAATGTRGKAAVSLLEAGTGIGKTLGYIAPASLWAEESGGTVWLSTYTRNLQRQLEQELARLYPDPAVRARRAVVRKGRENYLCLLNLEEALVRAGQGSAGQARDILLGLILRWLPYSRDGDMAGGDFPRWLISAGGQSGTLMDITDRRGECIHSACAHFKRCFVERAQRKSRSAHLVVANHALVLTSLARGGDPSQLPARLVFDEGHHLFAAADSAFSLAISGAEGAMMRRWLLGAERRGAGRASTRGRGLAARLGELTGEDQRASELLETAIHGATLLPGPGWRGRVQKAQPRGLGEAFLLALRGQVLAAAPPGRHSLESPAVEPGADLHAAATRFAQGLAELARALAGLGRRLQALQDKETRGDGQDKTPEDPRATAAIRGLVQRADTLDQWQDMLGALVGEAACASEAPDAATAPGKKTPAAFVDWLALSRADGRETDYGLHRHWLDPTLPLAETVLAPADGVIVTSATLRDQIQAAGPGDDWHNAESRVGGHHLVQPPRRAGFESPFDYAAQTKVFVVTDVDKRILAEVAAAYRALFIAARGGALGIFTAIERLRAVHGAIAPALARADLPLLAQHVDPMDTGTLVDIFRAEEQACLLGTDAVRDGIDVPGRSLRLIVFDRVPWPRPTILHKARRAHFGGRGYDDSLARLRLKQAFGRLIRGQDDHGVFIVLDAAVPSRLLSAFPPGVAAERLTLAQVIDKTREFLAP